MSNRITEQTKKWLVDALFELMKNKSYSEISVTEICKKAQLSRKTFYRRFASKDAILDYYFKKKISKYVSYVKEKNPQNFYELVTIFFSFWEREQDDLRILQKNNLLVSMLYEFNSQGTEVYNSINLPWHIDNQLNNQNRINLILLFSIGGFWNILSNQLEQNETLSAKELSININKALQKLLKG